MGSGVGTFTLSSVATNLSPNRLYYFRAVAQNAYGTNYGSTLSFTTPPVALPLILQPTPIVIIQRVLGSQTQVSSTNGPTPTPVAQQIASNDTSCFMFVPTLIPSNPSSGQDFTFNIDFKNTCNVDFGNVVLKIVMPAQTHFKSSNLPSSSDGNTLIMNLGPVYRNVQSSVVINGSVLSSAKSGDTLVFSVLVNFTDADGRARSIVAYLSDVVGANTTGSTLGASISNALSSWGWLLLLLIVLLLIAAAIFYFLTAKRRQELEYNKELETRIQGMQPTVTVNQ